MENSSINFAESIADPTPLEDQQSDFNPQASGPKESGDEEEEEVEDEGEDEGGGEDEGEGADNPPRDPKIVHSPVTTEDGGMPKRK